jgi:hypothetical protein
MNELIEGGGGVGGGGGIKEVRCAMTGRVLMLIVQQTSYTNANGKVCSSSWR